MKEPKAALFKLNEKGKSEHEAPLSRLTAIAQRYLLSEANPSDLNESLSLYHRDKESSVSGYPPIRIRVPSPNFASAVNASAFAARYEKSRLIIL